jgi:polyhydroxybutyrate depolymerase
MLILWTLLAALACAVTAWFWLVRVPAAPVPTLGAALDRLTIDVAGTRRTALAYVPKGLAPQSPLLIVLHGTGQDGATIRRYTSFAFDRFADQGGFAVYYPDGLGKAWNDCRPKSGTADDVGFLDALIERATQDHKVDAGRVHVFGFSNGGQMAFRLASERPGRFAGLATAAATLPTPDYNTCKSEPPTPPILLAHGMDDPISPYGGGHVTIFHLIDRGYAISAEATGVNFAARNGLAAPAPDGDNRWSVSRNGRPWVTRLAFPNGGHTIPQPHFRFPRLMGGTPTFDLPAEIVRFFGLA